MSFREREAESEGRRQVGALIGWSLKALVSVQALAAGAALAASLAGVPLERQLLWASDPGAAALSLLAAGAAGMALLLWRAARPPGLARFRSIWLPLKVGMLMWILAPSAAGPSLGQAIFRVWAQAVSG